MPATPPPDSWATSPTVRKTMQGNRRRDTRPELAIRRAVHARGLRYRVDSRPLKTVRRTADLVFSRARVAVFIDGCFWHGCPEHYRPPASNIGYWSAKVQRNQARDREIDIALNHAGWGVVRIWEHEAVEAAVHRIVEAVRRSSSTPPS
jgi:DNA mismatch endonuclease (patch repair protein)